jgi:uncharacterized tellurite resistance protein B-like protein
MSRDIFRDRERAEEEAYFHQRDAILIEKLRHRAKLDEIVHALAEKMRLEEPALLEQVKRLGVRLDTGSAFVLAPLVEVAWADGHVSHAEREAVLRLAERRGVVAGSADHTQLLEWLAHRPSAEVIRASLDAIRIALSVLPRKEAEERISHMIGACEEVARSSGGLERLLRAGGVLSEERAVIAAIRAHVQGGSPAGPAHPAH